jgi:hypothetical protein
LSCCDWPISCPTGPKESRGTRRRRSWRRMPRSRQPPGRRGDSELQLPSQVPSEVARPLPAGSGAAAGGGPGPGAPASRPGRPRRIPRGARAARPPRHHPAAGSSHRRCQPGDCSVTVRPLLCVMADVTSLWHREHSLPELDAPVVARGEPLVVGAGCAPCSVRLARRQHACGLNSNGLARAAASFRSVSMESPNEGLLAWAYAPGQRPARRGE